MGPILLAIIDALDSLGGEAKLSDIRKAMLRRHKEIIGRWQYPGSTLAGNIYKFSSDAKPVFKKGDPDIFYKAPGHGVWGLRRSHVVENRSRTGHKGADKPRAAISPGDANQSKYNADQALTPERIIQAIKLRRGQQQFRDLMISAYGGRCAISGCAILDILEAAHIDPFKTVENHHPENGILLRADLHTLFDCHLLMVDPVTRVIHLSPTIRKSPDYKKFHNKALRKPKAGWKSPSVEALSRHRPE